MKIKKDKKFFENQLKDALKKKDSLRVSVLRLFLATLHNEEIKLLRPLKEEEILRLIQRGIKQREEAASLYRQGGRPELAEKEEEEKKVLVSFLPPPVSEKEIRAAIDEARKAKGNDFGQIMGMVMAKWPGQVDGKKVASLVKEMLEGGGE